MTDKSSEPPTLATPAVPTAVDFLAVPPRLLPVETVSATRAVESDRICAAVGFKVAPVFPRALAPARPQSMWLPYVSCFSTVNASTLPAIAVVSACGAMATFANVAGVTQNGAAAATEAFAADHTFSVSKPAVLLEKTVRFIIPLLA